MEEGDIAGKLHSDLNEKYNTKKILRMLFIISLIVGLVFSYMTFKGHIAVYILRTAATTEGEVYKTSKTRKSSDREAIRSERRSDLNFYFNWYYRYSVDHNSYNASERRQIDAKYGKTVTVYYDKNKPSESGILNIDSFLLLKSLGFFALSYCFGANGERGRRYLLRHIKIS